MKTYANLPFLAAFFVALAHMPTHVYQICARQVGTLELEPWRDKATDAVRRVTRALVTILAALRSCAGGASPTWAAAALVIVILSIVSADAHGVFLATVIPAGLKALRQQAADIDAEIQATNQEIQKISAKVTSEKRAMTEAEKTQLAECKAKVADLKTLKALNADQLTEAEAENERQRAAAPIEDPDANASRQALGAGRVEVGRNNVEDDPKRGFKDHRDFLKAVMNAGRNPGRIDQRLKPLQAAVGSDEQGVYSDPHGGFLVPHGVAPGILQLEPEDDPFSGRVTPITMTAPTISFNARVDKNHSTSVSGGLRVFRKAETDDGTPSRMAFEQVTLTANEEFGLAYASERLITDSPQSIVDLLAAGFSDEYVANAMNERINGTGAGERQGILNTACKVSVAKETGQSAATIVKENIDKMAARCWRYSKAIYLANHNTRPQLKSLVQVVGTGGNAVPYFTTENGQEMLDGRPIYFTEFAKTLGTEGDLMLIVASQYLEGTYQSEQFAESIHVRFAAAERAFRFYRRNDGQWWWRSALTPKNGSTLSPVVTLATRS